MAGLKDLLRLPDFLPHYVGHAYVAALNGKAHGHQGAQKSDRGQYEEQQRHAGNPLQALAKIHCFTPVKFLETRS